MKRRTLSALAALAAAALALVARADDRQLPLRLWTFRLPGTELALDVADMNGDGRRDLVIAHMRAPDGPERMLSLFFHGPPQQRFQAEPERRWAVPPDACAFAAGDFDPSPGGEAVFLCPTRLVLIRGAGETVEVARVEGFFDYPEVGGLPVWDLATDVDGDGRPELFVPTKDGYLVFGRQGDGLLAERSRLLAPARLSFGPAFESKLLNRFLTASARLRRAVVVDLDGDGRKDVAIYRDGGLARFLQRQDGTFPERPDTEAPLVTVRRAEAAEEGRPGREGGGGGGGQTDAFANVRLHLEDVSGDGRADLIATRTLGEIGVFETLRTQQLLFRADAQGRWSEGSPDTVVNLKGVSGDPVFVDWNGDGRKDLIVSSYRMDLFTNVQRALLESMTITYMIFLAVDRPGPPYADDPDFVLDVDLPLAALERRGGAQPVLFTADLNGDGVGDMVSRRPEGGLSVVLGGEQRGLFGGRKLTFLTDRPVHVSVPATETPWVVDLDGDGKDELVLEPFAGEDEAARTVRLVGVGQ